MTIEPFDMRLGLGLAELAAQQSLPPEFHEMPKIARLSREMIVTEKLDGTNASVFITEDGQVIAGSRTRWIYPHSDNYGFARWVEEHKTELRLLGPGHHFGEWWGQGIQRGYDLKEKRWSLFNVTRWSAPDVTLPSCVSLVPVLLSCPVFDTAAIEGILDVMSRFGSVAAPGYMKPEGIVVYHKAGNVLFKKTLDKNDGHKGA